MRKKRKPIENPGLHKEMIISTALRKEVKRHGPKMVAMNRTGGIAFEQLKKSDPTRAKKLEPEIGRIFACAT